MTTCVVTKNGGSATVVLPSAWRKRNDVSIGDTLEIKANVDGQITFSKVGNTKTEAIDDLLDFLEELPSVEVIGDASKESDRRILAERYA